MGFFKRLTEMFSGGGGGSDSRFLTVYVLTNRCREPVAVRVDLHNEISRNEDEDGYYVRKVVHTSGAKRCFDQVEIELWLDKNHRILTCEIQGGRQLDEDAYQAELARFNAPPDDEIEVEANAEAETETEGGDHGET